MFDPTAFENMKVVLEGAVYDRDFDGDILVTNRKDLINLANMSREFTIEMEIKQPSSEKGLTGAIVLEASLENLSAELLPTFFDETISGITAKVEVLFPFKLQESLGQGIMDLFEDIWGGERLVQKTVSEQINNQSKTGTYSTKLNISFGRLIKEDQMDDLLEMVDYLIHTLNKSEAFLKK